MVARPATDKRGSFPPSLSKYGGPAFSSPGHVVQFLSNQIADELRDALLSDFR